MTGAAGAGAGKRGDARDEVTDGEARLLQEVAQRAAGRLDLLEWVALALAAALAAVGGGAVAWLLAPILGVPTRTLWVVASLLMFGLPGWAALRRQRRHAAGGH